MASTEPRKQTGRPRGFDREQALHRAVTIFWERGYDATSIADLTRDLGIAPPSLYAAFGDKRTLFIEAVDTYYSYFVKFLDEALEGAATAREAIEAVLNGVAEFYSDPTQPLGCLINSVSPPAGDPNTDHHLRQLRRNVRDRLRQRIQRGADAHELPPDTNLDELADLYWNTILGMSIRSRDGATRPELERTAALVMKAWPS
jgi:AcrR family transcriptional regulator